MALEPDGYYVDATFGRGGHTALLLQALGREGRVLAIDRDPEAVAAGGRRFAGEMRLALVHASFADIGALVPAHSGGRLCRGVLLDLGVSSPQLDDPARGFSFRSDGPLDMRMDRRAQLTAERVLNTMPERELASLIRRLGEERWAARIAEFVVRRRPLHTTRDLAAAVE